jgi:hypothetical protein
MIVRDRNSVTVSVTPEWVADCIRIDFGHYTREVHLPTGEAEKLIAELTELVQKVRDFKARANSSAKTGDTA